MQSTNKSYSYETQSNTSSLDASESAWPEIHVPLHAPINVPIKREKTLSGRTTPQPIKPPTPSSSKLDMSTIVESLRLYEDEMDSRCNKIEKLQNEILSLHKKLKTIGDKNIALERESAQKTASIQALEIENQDMKKATECQICFKDPISRVLSCGHVLCQVCTKTFLPDKCPFCQQKPIGYQHMFLN